MSGRTTRIALEEALRQRMRAGTYAPGSRLPTRRALLAEFRASPITLQRAFDHLIKQGYVTTVNKHASYVAERLPETCSYGLVFEYPPSSPYWNRFWSTLLHEGQSWKDKQGRRFECYFIHSPEGSKTASDHGRLCADLANGGLAGLVFANTPFNLLGPPISPSLTQALPRVCFGGDTPVDLRRYTASIIVANVEPAIEASFRWFASQRRKRVAGITSPQRAEHWRAHLPAMHRAGLETRDCWWLGFPPITSLSEAVRVTTRLLFDGRPHERPDALLIDDDNLVPWVTAGVAQTGIAVPVELSIAAHANVPSPTLAAVSCRRFGFDGRRLLASAVDELERLRAGAAQRIVYVEASFLDEALAREPEA